MKPIQYKFIIQSDGESRVVTPAYKSDISLEYELESGQQFFRKKLSGKLAFIRDDYDYLNAKDFNTEFVLLLQESKDGGKTWSEYYRGKFMKTDCTWDDDNKKCEVNPNVYDEYNDVIAGLDKEYNLIKLSPEIKRLTIKKRPLIQVYLPGESVISCFLGGTYWEQDVIEATEDEEYLVNKCYFANTSPHQEIIVKESPYTDLTNAVFVGSTKDGYSKVGDYRLEYFEYSETEYDEENRYVVTLYNGLKLYKGEKVGWQFTQYDIYYENYNPIPKTLPKTATLTAISPETTNVKVDIQSTGLYMRYLLDAEEILGLKTYEIPVDDLVEDNRNYKRCIGYAFDVIAISNNYSTEPTEYGVRPDGTYYKPPYSFYGDKYYPVARSTWNYASYWFYFSVLDSTVEEAGRTEFELRDTYPIHSVIKVLLEQYSDIKHEATEEYSKFLYGSYNPVSYQTFQLLLSPKSNILHGNYDQPAMKAQTTLNTILKMLRDVYKCFWFIEDGKLKIEHISYFRNGGTYTGSPVIGTDLTKSENPRNAKKWGFLTSSYEFDKSDMPERFQFAWMDDVTEGFEGYPIEVNSKYVSPGRIEDINVTGFTTDVDYMMLNPGAISQDGFALFAAIYRNERYELPIVERNVDGADLRLQNGYLSWITLQPNYYLSDLPAKKVVINKTDYEVTETSRKRKQKVKFPTLETIETKKLVKTYLGNGQIEKISVNLSSRINEVTLKYDTEQ